MGRKVLVSGASVAGPAVAMWLGRNGFDVTVVEKAPAVRGGGQAVDFKGRTHRAVLERMGVWPDIVAAQTTKTDVRLVDSRSRVKAVMRGEFLGGDVEILRGDLAQILHAHAEPHARMVFDDEIVGLRPDEDGVDVDFARRPAERFDVVIGADGIHSAVRSLAFGPEVSYVRHLGHYYAVADATVPTDDLTTELADGRAVAYGYNEPGRFAVLGGSKASQLYVFASDAADYDRHDVASQKAFLARHFEDAGWRVPEMLEAALGASDFYLDGLARTTMTSFTRGRFALVGDAGYANTLGGFGTGLALVGAYVLAGELVAAHGDHRIAFPAYDKRMAPLTKAAHRGNAGPFLAPPTKARIWVRDAFFRRRLLFAALMKVTDAFATADDLPTYELR